MNADEVLDQVPDIVSTIRKQNWKLGGTLIIDSDEAEAVIEQLVRAAYSLGVVHGSSEMGDRLLSTFDRTAQAQS
jgi:hypothetical protein